jgi:hypothetical protein
MAPLEQCHGPSISKVIAFLKERRFFTQPPHIYRVPWQFEFPLPSVTWLRAEIYRRPDSGVPELVARGTRLTGLTDARERFESLIRQLAMEDGRTIGKDPVPPMLQAGRISTSVDLPEGGSLDVIGPGGQIIAHDTAAGLQLDIVIRRRGQPLPSTWRDAEVVADELLRGFAIDGRDIDPQHLRLEFGYFELSKYEQQSILRPAMMTILDIPPDETGVPYRSVSVAAATEHPSLDLEDGLGNWHAHGGLG